MDQTADAGVTPELVVVEAMMAEDTGACIDS